MVFGLRAGDAERTLGRIVRPESHARPGLMIRLAGRAVLLPHWTARPTLLPNRSAA